MPPSEGLQRLQRLAASQSDRRSLPVNTGTKPEGPRQRKGSSLERGSFKYVLFLVAGGLIVAGFYIAPVRKRSPPSKCLLLPVPDSRSDSWFSGRTSKHGHFTSMQTGLSLTRYECLLILCAELHHPSSFLQTISSAPDGKPTPQSSSHQINVKSRG